MIAEQLTLIVASFVMGCLIVVAYFILMGIRKILKMGLVLCGITDFIFWETAAILLYIVIYKIDGGIIRGYGLAALILAMLLTRLVLKKLCDWYKISIKKLKTRHDR